MEDGGWGFMVGVKLGGEWTDAMTGEGRQFSRQRRHPWELAGCAANLEMIWNLGLAVLCCAVAARFWLRVWG